MESPPIEVVTRVKERLDLGMSESYFWVETETELRKMAEVLSKEKIFGISADKEDYLVDTIALHDCMSLLRPVFADVNICKVFHGADSDVLWLQRDFHIYVVNMFDTAKACEVLSKPQKSLASLLESYCGVVTNKLFQRGDWRQRPCQWKWCNMVAQMHTIFFTLQAVYFLSWKCWITACRRSNVICLTLYSKETEASLGASSASSIISRHLNGQSISSASCEIQYTVRQFCAWRDLMAHVHDESLRYVTSDQAIVALAEKAPTTAADMLTIIAEADDDVDSSFNSGLPSPSPVVLSHFDDFHYLLLNEIHNPDDLLPMILQNCLGQKGSCPLPVFNYALLVNCNMKVTLAPKQNGIRNSKIYASDGRLLCYCDRRKLEWAIHLPLCFFLNPKAGQRTKAMISTFKVRKICVGCGEKNHYLWYRIIPSCYRMHFPEYLKSHRSHDIILLCVDCHEIAHAAAEKYKRKNALEYGVPLFVRKVVDLQQAQSVSGPSVPDVNSEDAGVSPLQLQIAAMALLRHGPTMPSKRREELGEIVMTFYGGRPISEEDLEKALLVGMTPHEKRRLQKKNGFCFRHCKGNLPSDTEEKNTVNMSAFATLNAPEVDAEHDFGISEAETCMISQDNDVALMEDDDLGNSSLHTRIRNDEQASTSMDSEIIGASNTALVSVVNGNGTHEGRSTRNGSVDFRSSSKRKHRTKHSLLGHGPHGKQVVDIC